MHPEKIIEEVTKALKTEVRDISQDPPKGTRRDRGRGIIWQRIYNSLISDDNITRVPCFSNK